MLSKDEFAVLGLVAFSMVFMVSVLFSTSADCRRDALDTMCKVYGGATGGAVDVWTYPLDGDTGFYVKCDNIIGDTWQERFRYIVVNGSNVIQ